jgi:hypothetical protein
MDTSARVDALLRQGYPLAEAISRALDPDPRARELIAFVNARDSFYLTAGLYS